MNNLIDSPYFLYYMGVLGLIWGSFMGMVIHRLERAVNSEPSDHEGDHEKSGINLFGGSSLCIHCGQKLRSIDNIPILSWILLRGKSHCCRTKIPITYPLTEMIFCLATVFAFHAINPVPALISLAFLSICYSSAYVDLKTMLLPVENSIMLLLLSFVVVLGINPEPLSKIIYAIILYVMLHGINLMFRKTVIGEGDIPLLISLYLVSFAYNFNTGLIIASFISIGIFLYHLAKGKPYSLARIIPFGPGLCVAIMASVFITLSQSEFLL